MRAFIGLEVSEGVRTEIENVISELRDRLSGARWVPPENVHLTLVFLGRAEETDLERMARGLAAAVRSHPPFTLRFRGIGCFPSSRRPRVLWAGVADPPGALSRLHAETAGVVRAHGFPTEDRAFSPHLTIARFREPRPQPYLDEQKPRLETREFGTSPIAAVVLYESILKPSGAVYRKWMSFPLLDGDVAHG